MCNNHIGHGHLPKGVSRRDILKLTTAAVGIAALGPFRGMLPIARGAPISKKRFVVINFYGGHDTTNMVIPHTVGPYFTRRPTIALTGANGVLDLNDNKGGSGVYNDDYQLHPAMADIRDIWNDGEVAIVNKVGYPTANLSHFTSQEIYSRAIRADVGPLEQSGWIARWADANAPTPLSAAAVGAGRPADFVGGSSNPFIVQALNQFEIKGRGGGDSLNSLDTHRVEAVKSMLSRFSGVGNTAEAKAALDQAYQLADQVADALTNYSGTGDYGPNSGLKSRLRDISTLIEAGFETQIFFTSHSGFDTHGGQVAAQQRLLQQYNDAIRGFSQDLKAMGGTVWEDTVIIAITEFGRRNFENGSAGTDHGGAAAKILIGGGVEGGVYGPDITEADMNQNYLTYGHDFRSIYKEVLTNHMGSGAMDVVFPETIPLDTELGLV